MQKSIVNKEITVIIKIIMIVIIGHCAIVGRHSFGTYAKVSKKIAFLSP